MAQISYLLSGEFPGYARWYAWRAYSSDESPLLRSDFIPSILSIPIRPQGALLWRGQFETPIYGPLDARWVAMRRLMDSIDQGVNTMLLTVPVEQRNAGVLGATVHAQPSRIDPPVRGSRGETRGWTVDWVEVPA